VPGLGWAERCPECRWRRERRANRLALRISLAATALAAVYVFSRLRTTSTGRLWAALIVLAVFLMVRQIASKVAYQALPDEKAAPGDS
jgi:phosphoglycerol transferase MdoB-like AlkP superfamily enzyme